MGRSRRQRQAGRAQPRPVDLAQDGQAEDHPPASSGSGDRPAPLDRAGKISATQHKRWDEVRKARRARELLRMAEPILRAQAAAGDPTAQHIADRLREVL
jgi:hypothetical protein